MVNARERYSLRPTRSAQHWIAYHAIRRDAIFAPLLPGEVYDKSDPNEFAPGKLPHVLTEALITTMPWRRACA